MLYEGECEAEFIDGTWYGDGCEECTDQVAREQDDCEECIYSAENPDGGGGDCSLHMSGAW